jgi:hypothetical protein
VASQIETRQLAGQQAQEPPVREALETEIRRLGEEAVTSEKWKEYAIQAGQRRLEKSQRRRTLVSQRLRATDYPEVSPA